MGWQPADGSFGVIQHSRQPCPRARTHHGVYPLLESRREGPPSQPANRDHRDISWMESPPTSSADCSEPDNWQIHGLEVGSFPRKSNTLSTQGAPSTNSCGRGSSSAQFETPQTRRRLVACQPRQPPHHLGIHHACTCRNVTARSWIGVGRPCPSSLPGAPIWVACIAESGPVAVGCFPCSH